MNTDCLLRVGLAIAKTEEEAARQMMLQIKAYGHSDAPPTIPTDGKGAYREAMVETWGNASPRNPSGKGFPPERMQPLEPVINFQRIFPPRSLTSI